MGPFFRFAARPVGEIGRGLREPGEEKRLRQLRKRVRAGLRPAFRRLARDRRGTAVVEFMLSMMIILLVTLVIMEIAMLGSDLMITRYASFAAARGYLSHADYWRGGWEAASSMVINNLGWVEVEEVDGQGVKLRVLVEEYFPIRTLFGENGYTWLERETFLGREPDFSGDNKPDYSGGGGWPF